MTGIDKKDLASLPYTVTNLSDDRTISATETTAADIAAVLATLISDLQDQGILTGTEAAP